MTGRALRFGGVAEAYERFRPGYPVEIVEVVTAYARQPIRTALEIGAGTGKATRAFVQAGGVVTASEPDRAMLDELRKQVPNVTTLQVAFEDLALGERFGLVYSAAALHWTITEGRWTRIAALLQPGGCSPTSVVPCGWPIPRSSTSCTPHGHLSSTATRFLL